MAFNTPNRTSKTVSAINGEIIARIPTQKQSKTLANISRRYELTCRNIADQHLFFVNFFFRFSNNSR